MKAEPLATRHARKEWDLESYRRLLGLPDERLAQVDPLIMNLLVAKSIPSLSHLEISHYKRVADEWASEVKCRLPGAEKAFWKTPWEWKNDVNFFRLGVLCGYLEYEAGIEYNEDQRDGGTIFYTNPSDLFLNGVIDTRRGTCGNMAAMHVALGQRLGWPVSLACVQSHFICRYDDGKVTHNIEATQAGYGGFKSDPDEYLIEQYGLTPKAISSGSDLRAITPREMLGIFVGFRARHMKDTGNLEEAEGDWLLARHLFPRNRALYFSAMGVAVQRGPSLFEPDEEGAPLSLAAWINSQFGRARTQQWQNLSDAAIKDVIYSMMPQ